MGLAVLAVLAGVLFFVGPAVCIGSLQMVLAPMLSPIISNLRRLLNF